MIQARPWEILLIDCLSLIILLQSMNMLLFRSHITYTTQCTSASLAGHLLYGIADLLSRAACRILHILSCLRGLLLEVCGSLIHLHARGSAVSTRSRSPHPEGYMHVSRVGTLLSAFMSGDCAVKPSLDSVVFSSGFLLLGSPQKASFAYKQTSTLNIDCSCHRIVMLQRRGTMDAAVKW